MNLGSNAEVFGRAKIRAFAKATAHHRHAERRGQAGDRSFLRSLRGYAGCWQRAHRIANEILSPLDEQYALAMFHRYLRAEDERAKRAAEKRQPKARRRGVAA